MMSYVEFQVYLCRMAHELVDEKVPFQEIMNPSTTAPVSIMNKALESYDFVKQYEANLVSVLKIQALVRGYLTRNRYRQRNKQISLEQKLNKVLKRILYANNLTLSYELEAKDDLFVEFKD